jgi:glutaredoxin
MKLGIQAIGENHDRKNENRSLQCSCSTCKETIEMVRRIAGSSHELVIHDMQQSDVASKAKQYGIRSVPAVVVEGKLADAALAVARMSTSYDQLSRKEHLARTDDPHRHPFCGPMFRGGCGSLFCKQ